MGTLGYSCKAQSRLSGRIVQKPQAGDVALQDARYPSIIKPHGILYQAPAHTANIRSKAQRVAQNGSTPNDCPVMA
jgi:hypothetical protein